MLGFGCHVMSFIEFKGETCRMKPGKKEKQDWDEEWQKRH